MKEIVDIEAAMIDVVVGAVDVAPEPEALAQAIASIRCGLKKTLDAAVNDLTQAVNEPLPVSDVASRVDHFETVLSGPNGTQSEEYWAVHDAFVRADISQLREHREVCARLLPHLGQQSKIALLRSAKAKRRFWLSVVNGEAE